ncbi:MAG TPA: hypothetical protein VKC54_02810 [Patescibacteria group bacterium]|nr:hypothetical protein [Patescibacteria group bacterium]
MKVWNLKFSSLNKTDDIFDFLVSGEKTVETRSRNPNDGESDYANVKPGDVLHFKSLDTGKEIEKIVVSNHVYNSVEDLVENENVEKILPGIGSKENYLKQFEEVKNKFGEKYKYEVENYGMVAISFK